MGSRDFVMIDTQNVTNPLKLQIISFLIQHMYHCGKVQRKFSNKFGRSLSLVGELFPFTFPYRKYCQYYPLYRVKVSGGPCTIPPDEVLPQVAVKVPVHAFYCPMHSGYCTQPPGNFRENWRHRTSSRKISDHQIFSPLQSVFRQPSDFHSTFSCP